MQVTGQAQAGDVRALVSHRGGGVHPVVQALAFIGGGGAEVFQLAAKQRVGGKHAGAVGAAVGVQSCKLLAQFVAGVKVSRAQPQAITAHRQLVGQAAKAQVAAAGQGAERQLVADVERAGQVESAAQAVLAGVAAAVVVERNIAVVGLGRVELNQQLRGADAGAGLQRGAGSGHAGGVLQQQQAAVNLGRLDDVAVLDLAKEGIGALAGQAGLVVELVAGDAAFDNADGHGAIGDVLGWQVGPGHGKAAPPVVGGDAPGCRIELAQALLGAGQLGDQRLQLGCGQLLVAGDDDGLDQRPGFVLCGGGLGVAALQRCGGRCGQHRRLLQVAQHAASVGGGRGLRPGG